MRLSFNFYNTPEEAYLGDTRTRNLNIGQGGQTTNTIDDIDRTDSKLIKIIKLPYAPCDIVHNSDGTVSFPSEWNFENGLMRLADRDLSTEFESEIGYVPLWSYCVANVENNPFVAPNIDYESKLYNSEFFTLKTYYDSFVKEIPLENFKAIEEYEPVENNAYKLNIKFKPTNTINSKFAFKYNFENVPNFTYDKTEDFEEYLLVNRNNEETIFSNDFINYIRNGINYDKKQKNLQWLNLLGSGISFIQSGVTSHLNRQGDTNQAYINYLDEFPGYSLIGGPEYFAKDKSIPQDVRRGKSAFLSAAAINAGFSAVQNILNTALSVQNAERGIEQKKRELAAQSTAISGADDIDLLSYYCNNKMLYNTYRPREEVQNVLFDLFYYTGYTHNVQAIPNVSSRFWFNFIQCEPHFKDEESFVYHDYLEDIKNRYQSGVTVYHYHPEFTEHWNFDQDKENIETKLCDTSNLPTSQIALDVDGFTYSMTEHWLRYHIRRPLEDYEYLEVKIDTDLGIVRYQEKHPEDENLEEMTIAWRPGTPTHLSMRRVNKWNDSLSSEWYDII